MQHYRSLEEVHLRKAWLTIGQFDGVHRGHQEIIRKLTAGAHNVQAPVVVVTFFPPPAVVLGKRVKPSYLTTPDERAILLGDLGVDIAITHPFDSQVAMTSAKEFMSILKDKLGLECLMVGYDFALGRDRAGDVASLTSLGKQIGYSVKAIPPVKIDTEIISSSLIREALSAGQVERAARFLGRPYRISGEVVPGDGRGTTIGIPTANLNVWSSRAVPASGVYACQALVDGDAHAAVTNIGVRPTFDPKSDLIWVEVHLLDFHETIYGKVIQLDFEARLRDEQRFPNIQTLVDQIHQDIFHARYILNQ
jgi:riboflavin kinase/FMN adenylyltransferase